jgi:hypothetical protein
MKRLNLEGRVEKCGFSKVYICASNHEVQRHVFLFFLLKIIYDNSNSRLIAMFFPFTTSSTCLHELNSVDRDDIA